MLSKATYWLLFSAAFTAYSLTLGDIGSVIADFGFAIQSFLSMRVLTPIIALIAFPLLLRRIAVALGSRSFVSPKIGISTGILIIATIVFVLVDLLSVRYRPGAPLSFLSSLFMLKVNALILSSFIFCELNDLKGKSVTGYSSKYVSHDKLITCLVFGYNFILLLVYLLSTQKTLEHLSLIIFSILYLAIISAAGFFVYFENSKTIKNISISFWSIGIGGVLFLFSLDFLHDFLIFTSLGVKTISKDASYLGFIVSTLVTCIIYIVWVATIYLSCSYVVNKIKTYVPTRSDTI